MPGKVNPTQCEAMTMVCAQVHGATTPPSASPVAGQLRAQRLQARDHLQLPALGHLLTDASHGFVEFMIKGIEVDRAKIGHYVKNSLMLVTALAPKVGYDNAAKIAHTAHVERTSLKDAAVKLGHLTADEFDQWVKPEEMTKPK